MKRFLLLLLTALSLSACMTSVLEAGADFGKPPTNYQEKIRAYFARKVPHGEGAKFDFYFPPAKMWVELGDVFHVAPNWHGYRAVFTVQKRTGGGSYSDSEEMYADFRDDVIVGVAHHETPPPSD